jgi:hypothetical protein
LFVQMTQYTTPAFGSINGAQRDDGVVESPNDAAHLFAWRYARREFGERGRCHRVRLHCASGSGGYGIYEALIGVPCEGDDTSACSVWFTISVDPPDPTLSF